MAMTIAELKRIEDVRIGIMHSLARKPLPIDEIGYSHSHDLQDLLQLGLIETTDIKNDDWYWLSEAGFHKLGYKQPDFYGDPTCEECDGEGHYLGWEPGDDEYECLMCLGSGADPYEVVDLFALDEE